MEYDNNLFVHLADLHLAPRSGQIVKMDPVTGRKIRDLDMSLAFERAVDNIIAHVPLPSACVIAGDIFDTYVGSQDAIIDAAKQIKRLRDAGIEVLGIAGNHDTPTQKKKTPAFVVLQHEFATIAEDGGVTLAYDEVMHKQIGNIEYILLPHIPLYDATVTEEDLKPVTSAERTVLVVHGVAEGSSAFCQEDEMKEAAVAKRWMDMEWNYVAFGHYHKPQWIPGYEGKAAYCGSLENTVISGPDVCGHRGPVYVDLTESVAKMKMEPQPIRTILNIPKIDATGMEADQVKTTVETALHQANTKDAIVLLKVTNIPRTAYKILPSRNFQYAAPDALYVKSDLSVLAERKANAVLKQAEEGTDPADGETIDNGDMTVRPLEQEMSIALDQLIAAGKIDEKYKEDIKALLQDEKS